MGNWKLKPLGLTAGALVLATLIMAPVIAQQRESGESGAGPTPRRGTGPEAMEMMGRALMGHGGLARLCSDRLAHIAQRRLARIERIVRPTETQRAKFDELKSAAARAAELVRAACPAEQPFTAPGRLEAAEKGLEALLQAVKTVRPTLESFYQSLTDEQKARLNLATSRYAGRWGDWSQRWREGWQRDGERFDLDRRGESRRWGRDRWGGGDRFGENRGRDDYERSLRLQQCLQDEGCRREFLWRFDEGQPREYRWRDHGLGGYRLWREGLSDQDE